MIKGEQTRILKLSRFSGKWHLFSWNAQNNYVGSDLIELGVERGEQVGKVLLMLLYKVLENENLNQKEILIDIFTNTHS